MNVNEQPQKLSELSAPSTQASLSSWAPWIVLGMLLVVGIVGGLGLLPFKSVSTESNSAAVTNPLKNAAQPSGAAPAAAASAPSEVPNEDTLPTFPVPMLGRGLGEGGAAMPQTIEARHVLVQYKGSWFAAAEVKRTKKEAFARAAEALIKLKNGEDFEKITKEYTDSEDVRSKHGEFGVLDKDTTMRVIAAPAWALQIGQWSDPVESPFGIHVIQRTK